MSRALIVAAFETIKFRCISKGKHVRSTFLGPVFFGVNSGKIRPTFVLPSELLVVVGLPL